MVGSADLHSGGFIVEVCVVSSTWLFAVVSKIVFDGEEVVITSGTVEWLETLLCSFSCIFFPVCFSVPVCDVERGVGVGTGDVWLPGSANPQGLWEMELCFFILCAYFKF